MPPEDPTRPGIRRSVATEAASGRPSPIPATERASRARSPCAHGSRTARRPIANAAGSRRRRAGGAGALRQACGDLDRCRDGDLQPRPGCSERRSSRCGRRPTSNWVCVDQRRPLVARARSRASPPRSTATSVSSFDRRPPARLLPQLRAALALVPADARLVALRDQDDRWHPEKLATLRAELGGAKLVYSDKRSSTPTAAPADTYWTTGATTTRICPRC